MEITHIHNHKDQWIFEYGTALETKEIERLVSRLKDDFCATVKDISADAVAVWPIAE